MTAQLECIDILSARQHVFFSDNLVRKNYFDCNMYGMKKYEYCDFINGLFFKQMSPEDKCLHPTSFRGEMSPLNVNDVNYHKFSHSAASYRLNEENVYIMLEFSL